MRPASTELKLASPTISVQIRRLESSSARNCFADRGRNLVPTETGQVVYRYADEIFALGPRIRRHRPRPARGSSDALVIGVPTSSRVFARWLLEPALELRTGPDHLPRGQLGQLLAELSVQRVDVVLADAPISPTVKVRAYNHLLGETGLSFLGVPRLARKYRPGSRNRCMTRRC